MIRSVDSYCGINVGDERKIIDKKWFGDHWTKWGRNRLEDHYKIEEIIVTSQAQARGIESETHQYDPKYINVRISSVEDPIFTTVIGITNFLKLSDFPKKIKLDSLVA